MTKGMATLPFLVLTALADHPRHGYSMLQEIEAMTDGRTRPAVATLYRAVDKLAADGLIEEAGTEVVDGRFRRTYRLTESGTDALAIEAGLRASTARLAADRLGKLRPSGAAGLSPHPAGGAR